jgi:type IV secretion system protein VirB9
MHKLRYSAVVAALIVALPSIASDGVHEIVRGVKKGITQATSVMGAGATVKQFRYRSDEIYRVLLKPGMFTTVTIPKSEPILQFAVSNPKAVDLSVNQEANTGMLRLLNEETVSATVVTTKRAYYMLITPAPLDGEWHAGVTWVFDDDSPAASFGYRAPADTAIASGAARTGVEPSFDPMEAVKGHPNFEYIYDVTHPLAPAAVWDNGRFTWIQLRASAQTIPAVFHIGADGPEVVNFTVLPGGKQILVNRLMKKFSLRMGSESVVVSAR